jgi:Ni,Fe-hydrogenase III large subunit/Ni,Fe-hydrogenase III component G
MKDMFNAIVAALGADVRFYGPDTNTPALPCVVPRERFYEAAKAMKRAGAMLAAEWASDETLLGKGYGVYACYRLDDQYLLVKADLPADDPTFPSITKRFVPAYRFERQIESLMGVTPLNHPDLRPWIKFEDWPQDAYPLRKTFDPAKRLPRVKGEYRWVKVEGEGVYEIPVGPVHAGIIEPGHFRFSAVGEEVIHLEARLGYVHKGIEKRFEALSWLDGFRLAGRVSGDTTVAHSTAYCMALEDMTECDPPARAQWLRAIMLERERIANHLGDIGAICNDVAFTFMLYQAMRLKEIVLRTSHAIFGHRFMMDRVCPGGVCADIDDQAMRDIEEELAYVSDEFERLTAVLDNNDSFEDRARNTAVLKPDAAADLGVCGLVARASGLDLDCRRHFRYPPYDKIEVKAHVLPGGDVHARLWVRVEEVRESIRLIREMIKTIPSGPIITEVRLPEHTATGFSAVEGWRGEIIYWVQAGPCGEVNRVMVRDPSSMCWLGLEQAVPFGNIVPDFPICNKSFNQSYSGNDL